MNKDIIINGISINQLAEQRKALQQGASKFLSDTIDEVKKLVTRITEEEGVDVDALSTEAFELLKSAQLVSGVSGVQYYLDYSEDYGYGQEDTLSYKLESWAEDQEDDVSVYGGRSAIAKLYSQLQRMENDSYLWNSSSVHC